MVTTLDEAERLKAEGNASLKAGHSSEALALYQKALSMLPSGKEQRGPEALALGVSLNLNASLASLRLEAWEQAEDLATQALRLNPKSSKAFYRRGLARTRVPGIEADARRDFENALELEGGEGARLVRLEIERLNAKEAGGAGFTPPPDADSAAANRYKAFNESRESKVTWVEWHASQKQQALAAEAANAWRQRVLQATKCVKEGQGSDAMRRTLSSQLDDMAKKAFRARPSATAHELVLQQASNSEEGFHLGPGRKGVCFVAHGPLLFDGKSSRDTPFEELANPTGAFTVELWAACNGTTGHQCLLSSRNQNADGTSRAGYMFYVEPEGVWSFWVGAGKHWEKLYGSRVVLGRWTHLRGSVDPDAREAYFYVDRRLVAKQGVDFLPNAKQVFRLGAGQSEGEPRFFFQGDLRDVCVLGRHVADDDVSEEVAASKSSQESAAEQTLQQLPTLLRQGQGRGLEGGSALSAALSWSAAAITSHRPSRSKAAEDEFRKTALQLLESGASLGQMEGVSALFLSFNLQAALLANDGGEEIRVSFGAGLGKQLWAVILRCGPVYKILQEADGICSLTESLERQAKLRPALDGWVTQKDVAMWLTALDSLAFSLDASEVEDAVLTVFRFAYWATPCVSPEVKLENFSPNRSSKISAVLADNMHGQALEKVFQELVAEASR